MFRNIVLMYTTERTVIILLWILYYVLGIADVPILRVVIIVAYDIILHIHNVNDGL